MTVKAYLNCCGQRIYLGVFRADGGFDSTLSMLDRYRNIYPLNSKLYHDRHCQGIFSDYFPDGWHKRLLERILKKENPRLWKRPEKLYALQHPNAWGAVEFEPQPLSRPLEKTEILLSDIAAKIDSFGSGSDEYLLYLWDLGASLNGHMPKVCLGYDVKKQKLYHSGAGDWIIKIPESEERRCSGAAEYVYNRLAQEAGIDAGEFYLFPSAGTAGYFGSRRFDRQQGTKIHCLSATALIDGEWMSKDIDAQELVQLTGRLTGNDHQQMLELFRRLVFAILTGNNDLRSCNVAYRVDADGTWQLAPAYDLMPPDSEERLAKARREFREMTRKIVHIAAKAGISAAEVRFVTEKIRTALEGYERLYRSIV